TVAGRARGGEACRRQAPAPAGRRARGAHPGRDQGPPRRRHVTSRLADPDTLAAVIVVTRFRVPQAEQAAFRGDLERARQTLAGQRGYVAGRIGRNVDDPELWVLTTE